ncbi:T9SS type A sorting domain-containing protein [Flavobacterium psychrotolerans]|uniref:Zinc metalloprotease n=1 Tax=Flavobacterium psychrotolerans TaxID=2169410 RepID=A0A2U1JMI2_9FLAO|nr:T9SS type A sorting domain-containing protein [Flavobacterium psychrotolerans]PWA06189.1 hypothetical protein DB895_04630 [Flavobacterium psychrotolerans]
MKKNITLKRLLLMLLLSIASSAISQNSISLTKRTPSGKVRCASTEYEQYLRANNPKRATKEEFENWIAPKIQELKNQQSVQRAATVITIPIVIHIIHNGDAIGKNENISDEQALSQITVLNQDFRKMAGTPGENSNPVGADLGIEFCMAQRKPDGTATNGIDRVKKTTAQYATMTSTEAMKAATQWDPTKYFNIWTVYFSDTSSAEMNGTLGYAQFPATSGLTGLSGLDGEAANTDGLVIDYRAFGTSDIVPAFAVNEPYDKGRTASHEIGHCFGLLHIWGDGNGNEASNSPDCTATDYCADTPQAGWEHYDCGTFNTCTSKPGNDMPENYMDYSPDACMNIFTLNQKDRITAVMNNSPRRKDLKTSDACLAPLATDKYEFLNKIQLYPNPAKNILNIAVSQSELPDGFTVYNSLGQMVGNKKIGSITDLNVNTTSYSKGIYFIKIVKGNSSKTLQFIKE